MTIENSEDLLLQTTIQESDLNNLDYINVMYI